MKVRTRVAPSPTGDPHVGTAYMSLFNYCFAKKHGGQFILRIEDTDQVRSSAESEAAIFKALRWTGLTWDEGPDVGGPHGPYRQSERTALYQEHAARLLEAGHAFRCFLTDAELKTLRAEHQTEGRKAALDSPYALVSKEESEALAASGRPFVIRMRVPREGTCTLQDGLRGAIEIPWDQVDQQVLLKSDGFPTYHLANVVDDHHMEITHVMRGEEWISSAPKHQLLYQYFGWQMPELIHLPLLRNPDKSKLSKRKNPTSILYYERMGFLPEALLNYLGRMAWSMPDDREKFDLATMVEHFTLDRVSLGGPVFDIEKLSWLNGKWLREDFDDDQLAARIAQWAFPADRVRSLMPLVRPRMDRMSDAIGIIGFFFQGLIELTPESLANKKLSPEQVKQGLCWTMWSLDSERVWEKATIEAVLRRTGDLLGHKLRDFLGPFFVAVSGRASATPLFETMAILGRDLTRARLRHAVDVLGGLSGKEEKRWRDEHTAAVGARDEGEAEA